MNGMDPFRICVAVLPLSMYVMLLGIVNVLPRPLLTSGVRDMAALSVGVAGLFIIGPLELFMPEAAAARFGPYVWLLLMAAYGLSVTFLVLVSRPRLVIYNITPEQLRPVLSRVVMAFDADARWAGDSLFLPQRGVQCHLESFSTMRHVSLVASGPRQDLQAWHRLEQQLAAALENVQGGVNPRGVSFCIVAAVVLIACMANMISHPLEVAEGCSTLLRR